MGSFSLLSPSSLPIQNATLFSLLRNQMYTVNPSVSRKIAGVESSVKRRDIVSLVSAREADKDVGSLY